MSSEWDIDHFKIKDLVDPVFGDLAVNLVDFKRHLAPPAALTKKVTYREDGRPVLAEYSYNGEVMSKRHFYYIVDGNNMLVRRTVLMCYVKTDGSEGPEITLENQTYSAANTAELFAEQITARKTVTAQIKKTTLEALVWVHYPTLSLPEIVALGIPFIQASEVLKSQFEEYGYPFYKDFIAACNPLTTGYEWLGTDIGGGATLQDYMVGALTYDAVSNHPDA